ncbi:hypothetical protein FRC15_003047 [Serendipita sp. 397]|nr:hypothetical protein FRC15_003047 [Serendipita sp. 397]
MSSKKGPGRFVAAHQTEAARRALIQPVPCWEYKWVVPPGMSSGSTLRVRQWVRTEKKQEFSDDEDDSIAALAPLPDEPEQGDEDEEDEEMNKDKDAGAIHDGGAANGEGRIRDGLDGDVDVDGENGSVPPIDTPTVPSGLGTPLPAETSMRGVPGLDTPISGSMTPSTTLDHPAGTINLASRLAAVASSSSGGGGGAATGASTKPHPLSTSFVPSDLLDSTEDDPNMVDQTMLGDEEEEGDGGAGGGDDMGGVGEGSLIDSMSMDAVAAAAGLGAAGDMDGLEVDNEAFMDMLNSGNIDLGGGNIGLGDDDIDLGDGNMTLEDDLLNPGPGPAQ